jgi:hypothetical protein
MSNYQQPNTDNPTPNAAVGVIPLSNGDVIRACPNGVPPTPFVEPLTKKEKPTDSSKGDVAGVQPNSKFNILHL